MMRRIRSNSARALGLIPLALALVAGLARPSVGQYMVTRPGDHTGDGAGAPLGDARGAGAGGVGPGGLAAVATAPADGGPGQPTRKLGNPPEGLGRPCRPVSIGIDDAAGSSPRDTLSGQDQAGNNLASSWKRREPWVPSGSVLRTRAGRLTLTAWVRGTEPRGTPRIGNLFPA
jgi:hypothetical protein